MHGLGVVTWCDLVWVVGLWLGGSAPTFNAAQRHIQSYASLGASSRSRLGSSGDGFDVEEGMSETTHLEAKIDDCLVSVRALPCACQLSLRFTELFAFV